LSSFLPLFDLISLCFSTQVPHVTDLSPASGLFFFGGSGVSILALQPMGFFRASLAWFFSRSLTPFSLWPRVPGFWFNFGGTFELFFPRVCPRPVPGYAFHSRLVASGDFLSHCAVFPRGTTFFFPMTTFFFRAVVRAPRRFLLKPSLIESPNPCQSRGVSPPQIHVFYLTLSQRICPFRRWTIP